MALGAMTERQRTGGDGKSPLILLDVQFAGDAVYPMAGTPDIETTLRALAENYGLEVMAVISQDCGDYKMEIVQTGASVTCAATYATADQDTNTLTYILNGAAVATLTLAGAHTTVDHIVASWNAVAGLHAYAVGGQCFVETDEHGPNADFQITGGTANAVYLFPTTANVGTTAKKLMVRLVSSGAQAQVGAGTTDLSGVSMHGVFVCR